MAARYSTVAIALHWAIAVLLIGQIAGGFYMHGLPDENAAFKFQLYQLHKSFGITILALTVFRLVWRLTHKPPPLPAGMAAWERLAARATHWGFYALLLAIPLLGWLYVSASPFNVPTMLFGVVHLPHLPFFEGAADRRALAGALMGGHELMAKLAIALIVLHVGAALKHHFVNRDDVLARMAPLFRRKAS